MKIEIEISDKDAATLAHWASVSRTLATATGACEAIRDGEEVSDTDTETYSHCAREMRDLRPALDKLHYQARQAIWNIANRERAIEALSRTTPEQRAAAWKIVNSTTNPQYHSYYDRIVTALGISASLWPVVVIDWLASLDTATWEVRADA